MNNYTIMIVDDEPDIQNLLEKSLSMEGFRNIIKTDNGLSAVSACKELQPDVIILDVMLPGLDGYEVCKQIREFSHCPILFLSSKNDELDKILGLAVGGDDYVTKPFSPKEVAFRVKAQLRRLEYKPLLAEARLLKVGALRIDPEGCRVMKDGKEMELTAREFEILRYMAQNIGRVISRERLYETVWGEDSFGCDNTVMVHIRHLREKIESDPASPEYLITMKGLGYKLVNPYER
ncbi:MAG: response regulator transcription factor [Lachnospiraceae bacterium]|uniref:response regulator transcription factor n=1 Tax=uncultured Acetatifactor sp. TaxID=1671927 RepID=UPI00262CFD7E|nr:response regulator transcription factor [uncultured Acetatifactor sp.]MCI8790802.1 response regulator transcription factor [Lachnospiraceae bacterium]